MNAEKIYKNTTEAMRVLVELHEIKGEFLEELKRDPDGCTRSSLAPIRVLGVLMQLQRDALHEMQHKAGRGSQLSGAKSLLKVAKKGCRKDLQGTWVDGEGRQCMCTGYHAARLTNHLEGLPCVPSEVDPLNLDNIITGPKAQELPLPSVAELKAHIAQEKAENPDKYKGKRAAPVLYDFGDSKPIVNAQYLLDLLQLLPECAATWDGNPKSIIMFNSQDGDGCLCPVRRG